MTTTSTMSGNDDPIRVIVEERIAALRDRDPDRLAAVYASQIVMFSLAPPLQDTGPGVAGPDYWKPWLDSWAGPLTLEVTELGIAIGGDIAFCHSLNRMRGSKTDGGQQDLWFRATLGLRKTGAGWQITHEHNSTPFYMDGSGLAATDLQPEAGSA